jgi:hypothetical protein
MGRNFKITEEGAYTMKWFTLIFGFMLIGLLTVQCAGSQMAGDTTARAVFAVR